MSEANKIEQQIREILNAESDAIAFSNKLFSPEGLFNKLAETQEQRRQIVESALFKEAQQRLAKLRRQDTAAFATRGEDHKASSPNNAIS